MNGYCFDVSCPRCGSDLQHVNSGKLIHTAGGGARETRVVCRCPECPSQSNQFVIEVFLRSVSEKTGDSPCGTTGGYQRHQRNGTPACEECLNAHRRFNNPEQLQATGRPRPGWESRRKEHVALLRRMETAS